MQDLKTKLIYIANFGTTIHFLKLQNQLQKLQKLFLLSKECKILDKSMKKPFKGGSKKFRSVKICS